MKTRLQVVAALSCACCLSMALWARAQQTGAPAEAQKTPFVGVPVIDTPVLPSNPTTKANAAERVRAALMGAREAQVKNGPSYMNAPAVDRLREDPSITLPLLAPYAVHPSDLVRDVVGTVAFDAVDGESMLGRPVDEGTRSLAMRLLAQVASFAPSISAGPAVQALYDLVANSSLPGRSEPTKLIERYARAGVKRGLMRHLSAPGFPNPRAVAVLSLFKDDSALGDFLARVAKRERYPFVLSLALTQWNDGNALEAVEYRLNNGQPRDLAYVAENIRFVDHPQVLRVLASHLDDKRETVPVKDAPNGGSIYARVCDHILSAFQFKLEGKSVDLERPEIASDDQIAKAKARFPALIDALPTPGARPA